MRSKGGGAKIARMATTPKRPRDANQLAKRIVDISTGEQPNGAPQAPRRGHAGGLKGGKARAKSLSPDQRADIARIAAEARWKKGRR